MPQCSPVPPPMSGTTVDGHLNIILTIAQLYNQAENISNEAHRSRPDLSSDCRALRQRSAVPQNPVPSKLNCASADGMFQSTELRRMGCRVSQALASTLFTLAQLGGTNTVQLAFWHATSRP